MSLWQQPLTGRFSSEKICACRCQTIVSCQAFKWSFVNLRVDFRDVHRLMFDDVSMMFFQCRKLFAKVLSTFYSGFWCPRPWCKWHHFDTGLVFLWFVGYRNSRADPNSSSKYNISFTSSTTVILIHCTFKIECFAHIIPIQTMLPFPIFSQELSQYGGNPGMHVRMFTGSNQLGKMLAW